MPFSIFQLNSNNINPGRQDNLSSSSPQEGICRPNENIRNEWGDGETSDYTRIDDEVEKPTAGDGTYNSHAGNYESKIDIFGMTTIEEENIVITSITIHLYCKCRITTMGYAKIEVNFRFGNDGVWSSKKSVQSPYGWGWKSFTWSGLSVSKCELDNLQIKLRALIGASGWGGWVAVDAMYADIEYNLLWCEGNEGYNIGDFPSNEWNPYYGDEEDIEVVMASSYNVDMAGKVIRMSESLGCTGMIRVLQYPDGYPINPGEALYFKFQAQVSQVYIGDTTILLAAENTAKFFEITFDSYYEEIKINMANEQFYHLDLTFDQVYDFDIIFFKIPDSNTVQYYVFINQKLEITGWVNTAYYPKAIDISLNIYDGGPGEFFLDNFFLGYVDKEVFPEEYIEVVVPMYYLYSPEFYSDQDIDSIDMKYRYKITETHTITTSFSMGFSFGGILGLLASTPLSEVVTFYTTDECEVSTNGLDLVIFNLIEANKRDITFYLPGLDPETGASNITALYEFTMLNQSIKKFNIDHFESVFGEKPENFDYCKNHVSYVKDLTFIKESYGLTDWLLIESRNLKSSYSYTIAATLGFNLGKYVKFNLGLLFTFSYSYVIETDAKVGIRWSWNEELGREVIVNIFAPPIGSYSTPLDLPPYSAEQVV